MPSFSFSFFVLFVLNTICWSPSLYLFNSEHLPTRSHAVAGISSTLLNDLTQSSSTDALRLVPPRDSLFPLPVVTAGQRAEQPFASLPADSSRLGVPAGTASLSPSISTEKSTRHNLSLSPTDQASTDPSVSLLRQSSLAANFDSQPIHDRENLLQTSSGQIRLEPPSTPQQSPSPTSSPIILPGIVLPMPLGGTQNTSKPSPREPPKSHQVEKSPESVETAPGTDASINLTVQRLPGTSAAGGAPVSTVSKPVDTLQLLTRQRPSVIAAFSQSLDSIQHQQQSLLPQPSATRPSRTPSSQASSNGHQLLAQERSGPVVADMRRQRQPRRQVRSQPQHQAKKQRVQQQAQRQEARPTGPVSAANTAGLPGGLSNGPSASGLRVPTAQENSGVVVVEDSLALLGNSVEHETSAAKRKNLVDESGQEAKVSRLHYYHIFTIPFNAIRIWRVFLILGSHWVLCLVYLWLEAQPWLQ